MQRDFFEIALCLPGRTSGTLPWNASCLAAEAEGDRERQIFLEMAGAWTVVAF